MEDNAFTPEKKRQPPATPKKKKKSNRFVHQSDDDNKFAETLTTPTVEECVCFLERNTTMRQIIGLLIELEEDQDGNAKSNSSEEKVVVDESKNAHNDSVSSRRSEDDSYLGYDDASDLWGGDYKYHYSEFIKIKPTVSWRDLAADDDNIKRKHFGLDEESSVSYSENEYDTEEDDDDDDDGDDDDSVEASSQQSDIPTLQELAFMKVSAQFQKDSKTCEQQHKNLLASLLEKTKSKVREIYRHYQEQLKESPEWAIVCLLESLTNTAKGKLDVRSKWQYHQANSRGIKIIRDANKRRAEIWRNWFSERQSILDDHSSFLDQHKPRGDRDGDDGNVQHNLLLCVSPDCRKLFTPHLLPEKKRCMVRGCMSTHVNCGCGMKKCRTCRGPVCKEHYKSRAAHSCSRRARRTCGYYSDGFRPSFVKSRFCNRVFDNPVRGRCCHCLTRCCPDCLTYYCRNCNSTDCKVCIERGHPHECFYSDDDY